MCRDYPQPNVEAASLPTNQQTLLSASPPQPLSRFVLRKTKFDLPHNVITIPFLDAPPEATLSPVFSLFYRPILPYNSLRGAGQGYKSPWLQTLSHLVARYGPETLQSTKVESSPPSHYAACFFLPAFL